MKNTLISGSMRTSRATWLFNPRSQVLAVRLTKPVVIQSTSVAVSLVFGMVGCEYISNGVEERIKVDIVSTIRASGAGGQADKPVTYTTLPIIEAYEEFQGARLSYIIAVYGYGHQALLQMLYEMIKIFRRTTHMSPT
jgi:hypothetical protein